MISLVINCDTRPGCGADVSTTGDSGEGSLQGVRSWDFLTDGVINKINFFRGHELEVILYVDEHDIIPGYIIDEIVQILSPANFACVCKAHDRSHPRWNELIYLEALKLARGEYVAHFDSDCAAFRDPSWDAGVFYKNLLDMPGPRFICQPTTMSLADHGMWWASTRFFMCKAGTIDFERVERAIRDEGFRFQFGHCPALEHVLGRMVGHRNVLYPPADWDKYMIFCWSRYKKGTLSRLNALPYGEVRNYILSCGIHGPNDVLDKI